MDIQSGVPVPDRSGGRRPPKYPFRKLEVGDSVFLSGDDGIKMEGAAWVFAHRNKDFGLTTRRVTEEGVAGVRVWRYR